jgi:hypothetical protein
MQYILYDRFMKISPEIMTSTDTPHVARWSQDTAADGNGAWVASWLPSRLLSQDQAVTSMMIAEKLAQGAKPGDRVWPYLENWARELGLTDGAEAVKLVGSA